ncbi:E3 ubiquitin-protein ligase makorin-1-like [Ixodes scapularis]|uniref:E3 ubiquitin-protein ligase makorin-1-like n=1 Tax=Ixodes scapularis TaxID=6945 RepID=UPI001A9DC53F|nr:E3 ubiquitin-protein ligase makorin-1-like [Ixodes scapularis]
MTSNRENLHNVCRHYLRGNCMYGSRCRYEHIPAGRGHANKPKNSRKGQSRHRTNDGHREPSHTSLAASSSGSSAEGQGSGLPSSRVTQKNGGVSPYSDTDAGPRKLDTHKAPLNWVDAPEFVPKSESGVQTSAESHARHHEEAPQQTQDVIGGALKPLCPFRATSEGCLLGKRCLKAHPEQCDLCQKWCLHPDDQEQRRQHKEECVQKHEEDMELSFAVQRSADKSCGICMDVVIDKEPSSERRFGILEKCCHVFCLSCIRKWRGSKEFDSTTVRSCPECRTQSDFVTPSSFWVEVGPEKDKLIAEYKKAMSVKPCRYFQEGRGICPFGRACFYQHLYPDRREAVLPPPRRRRRENRASDIQTLHGMYLWDFLDLGDHLLFPTFNQMLPTVPDTDDEEIEWNSLLERYAAF